MSLRGQQNANQLLAALTEEQLVQAKRQRDAEAQAFNDHIQFMSQAESVMAAQAAGASDAMLAWKMP
jgi:transcription initiation factor IIE alpha subunit